MDEQQIGCYCGMGEQQLRCYPCLCRHQLLSGSSCLRPQADTLQSGRLVSVGWDRYLKGEGSAAFVNTWHTEGSVCTGRYLTHRGVCVHRSILDTQRGLCAQVDTWHTEGSVCTGRYLTHRGVCVHRSILDTHRGQLHLRIFDTQRGLCAHANTYYWWRQLAYSGIDGQRGQFAYSVFRRKVSTQRKNKNLTMDRRVPIHVSFFFVFVCSSDFLKDLDLRSRSHIGSGRDRQAASRQVHTHTHTHHSVCVISAFKVYFTHTYTPLVCVRSVFKVYLWIPFHVSVLGNAQIMPVYLQTLLQLCSHLFHVRMGLTID